MNYAALLFCLPVGLVACAACSSVSPLSSVTGRDGATLDGGVPSAAASASDSGVGLALTGAPSVRFVGRFVAQTDGSLRFSWSNSTILVRFRGTGLSVRLRDFASGADADGVAYQNHFTVLIDGVVQPDLVLHPGESSYVIGNGLAAGVHDVRIVRASEALVGPTEFVRFDYDSGGGPTGTPVTSSRRIELIGDSITCGYGVLGADETCHYSPATSNGYIAYGPLAARALGAEVTTACWSGKGVYRNNDDSTDETMPVLYGRSLPGDATSGGDFAASTAPDAVVINLSTNDFASGNPDETSFVAAYAGLLQTVRAKYPGTEIFAALGPMISDSYPSGVNALTTARTFIQEAIAQRAQGGDAKVHFVEFPVQTGENGYGCDYHPSRKTHELMGAQLADALKKILGW